MPFGRTSRMPVGDHAHVRLRDRRIPLVGRQHALAAEGVVGRQPGTQLGVGDVLLEVTARNPLRELHQLRVVDEARHQHLAAEVDGGADGPLQRGEAAVEAPLDVGDRRSRCGITHGRRALEQVEVLDDRLDLRHGLDRRRARADHRDAAAGEVVVVVPARRMEGLALEVLEAGQRGCRGLAQKARRRDQQVHGERSLRGLDPPDARRPRPIRRRSPRSRGGCGRARRSGRCTRAGSAAAQAGADRCGSSPGWARRRTSTGARGCRTGSRDSCSPTRCRRPRCRAPRSRSRRCRPASA